MAYLHGNAKKQEELEAENARRLARYDEAIELLKRALARSYDAEIRIFLATESKGDAG